MKHCSSASSAQCRS